MPTDDDRIQSPVRIAPSTVNVHKSFIIDFKSYIRDENQNAMMMNRAPQVWQPNGQFLLPEGVGHLPQS